MYSQQAFCGRRATLPHPMVVRLLVAFASISSSKGHQTTAAAYIPALNGGVLRRIG